MLNRILKRYDLWRVEEKRKLNSPEYRSKLIELARQAQEAIKPPNERVKKQRDIPTIRQWCDFQRHELGVKMDESKLQALYYKQFPTSRREPTEPLEIP